MGGSGKKILIIDDEISFVELVESILVRKGYEVSCAFDGKEGLKKLKDYMPDLLILDINMPKMNGIELYSKICKSYSRTTITPFPVLVVTAREELRSFFEDIEADGFLSKPFEVQDLLNKVEKLLNPFKSSAIYLLAIASHSRVKEIVNVFEKEKLLVKVLEDFESLKNEADLKKPHFIVMEFVQKDISGERCIQQIRQLPNLKEVPLLVFSHSGFKGLKEKALQAGATEFIEDTSDPNQFFWAIRQLANKLSDKSKHMPRLN